MGRYRGRLPGRRCSHQHYGQDAQQRALEQAVGGDFDLLDGDDGKEVADGLGHGLYYAPTNTDALIATATTDAGGHYLFNDLPPGTFFVNVVPPQEYTQTGDPDATLDNATMVILTTSQVTFLDADFGYQNTGLADISGSIWNDLNRNAVDDGAGEPPLPGITVALLDANGNIVATTITDESGDYTFFDVPPGDHTVIVTDKNGVLNGYQLTSGLDAIPVTVAESDITGVDFGYARNPAVGAIGDRVWVDADRDGVQDGGENGIANATVWLKAAAPILIDGISYNTGDVIATSSTDLNGNYLFSGLPAGSYSDSSDQGETDHDILSADASGNWSYVGGPLLGPNLTATAIDNSDNTSEFSTPVSFEVGYKVFLALAIKNH